MALRGRASIVSTAASRWILPSCAFAHCSNCSALSSTPFFATTKRHRGLAPSRRRHADHGNLGDVGLLADHRLEIARVDVETARDDHVLFAVQQREKAVFVEAAHVTRAKEALAGLIEPFGFRRSGRLPVITGHHRARMADHLADFAARHLAIRIVDQADVVSGGGAADGMQFVRMLVGKKDGRPPPSVIP